MSMAPDCGGALLLLNRNRARYQGSLLGADRPYQITLNAVCVDALIRFDPSNQGTACVRMLQPLLPASGADRGENERFLHGDAVLVLCSTWP